MIKRKKLIVIISVITAALLIAGVILTILLPNKKKLENVIPDDKVIIDSTHDGKADETNYFILNDEKVDYVIVHVANASLNELRAAQTLQTYFLEATGHILPIKIDTDVTWSDSLQAVSVGANALATAANVKYDYMEKSSSGFQIRTVGKTIFLLGGKFGVMYSAYELLSLWFNFDYFAENSYTIDKAVKQLKLFNYEINELPDIETRTPYLNGTLLYGNDPSLADALRINKEELLIGYGTQTHNTFNYVPWTEYGKTKREWFSPNVDNKGIPYQLCFSRKSDEYLPIVLEKVKEVLLKNPTKSFVTFTNQDTRIWCTCAPCKESIAKYGCNSASYIQFMNKLAKQTREWAATALNREVKICGQAYLATEPAPVKYNAETDTFAPIDDSVIFDKGLAMQYAPHANCNYYVPFDNKENEADYKILRSWAALTDNLLMWTYNQAVFQEYMIFYDNFSSIQRNYQILTKFGTVYLLDQGQYNNSNSTGFNILRTYVSAKLMWNSQLDYKQLINKFFNNYFGEAAQPMKEVFEALQNRYAFLHETGVLTAAFKGYVSDTVYPKGFVDQMLKIIDSAYEKIENLKLTNPAQYQAIYDRICLESISFRYLICALYSPEYTAVQFKDMASSIKADCTRLRITKSKEFENIGLLWDRWGV